MIFFLNHYESIIFVLDEYGTTTNARIFALKEFINTVAIKARARARAIEINEDHRACPYSEIIEKCNNDDDNNNNH